MVFLTKRYNISKWIFGCKLSEKSRALYAFRSGHHANASPTHFYDKTNGAIMLRCHNNAQSYTVRLLNDIHIKFSIFIFIFMFFSLFFTLYFHFVHPIYLSNARSPLQSQRSCILCSWNCASFRIQNVARWQNVRSWKTIFKLRKNKKKKPVKGHVIGESTRYCVDQWIDGVCVCVLSFLLLHGILFQSINLFQAW